MKIVGILTEFNPFHNGHAWLLSQLRRALGENSCILCLMSGQFVQRGEPAMLRKHARAEAALRCGADLVLELPLARALSSAEGFARGAVYLMQRSGCVTHLAFGSECGDAAALERVAQCLDSEMYRAGLRRFLDEGMPFAACRQAVVRGILGPTDAALLSGANNNLGVEYLKAARQLGWSCSVLTVKRRGAAHDSPEAAEFCSASAVRRLLEAGDWQEVEKAVPAAAADIYRAECAAGRGPVTAAAAERMILARLRTMDTAAFSRLPDCAEGLEHRFLRAARSASSLEELLGQVKTKRYAFSRLRRMALCAWLGVEAEDAAQMPQYLRLLGCTERGRAALGQMRRTAQLPVLVKSADVRRLSEGAQRQFSLEARAGELYGLLYPDLSSAEPGEEWRTGPVVVKDR
ncbi:MAG: nucleotidyltransferase family protein [Clostridiales bacterium]|nr:nucleotidyltransferase family protein [bacterium 210917-SL.2.15]MCI5842907.1 nucleotidyltransferase family protein [Clostridiales bacterium]